jgi:hypothetical protein
MTPKERANAVRNFFYYVDSCADFWLLERSRGDKEVRNEFARLLGQVRKEHPGWRQLIFKFFHRHYFIEGITDTYCNELVQHLEEWE